MEKNSKIYIAGHKGMVGAAIYRQLESEGYKNLVVRSSSELDLRDQSQVKQFFEQVKPEYVFLAAAKVGGIVANNTYRADFLYDNLMIEANLIHSAWQQGVRKLLFLGSSCIYPKLAPQPMREQDLLTGPLETTNEPYAIAKIAGIKLCEAYRDQYGCNFIAAMPTNLYGPGDNYHLQNSHVIPAMIRKFHVAKIDSQQFVELWGTGNPLREFMYVDDLAGACLFLMENYNERDFINIGNGQELTIRQLAILIADTVGFEGEIRFNSEMPDGTPRKLMDSSRLTSLGWTAKTELREGLRLAYRDFLKGDNRQ
ncbi:MAG: GDP-L-fucose synthase family protein [Chitinophagaceae bacterium]